MTIGSMTRARLVALFFLGTVLFNFPVLSLASREIAVVGIPILVAYSFLSWAVLILLIAVIAESKKSGGTTLRESQGWQSEKPKEGKWTSR